VTTEAQQLLDAAFAGKLNLDADAGQEFTATANSEPENPPTDAEATGTAAQDDEQPAPIASKSGAYTIPFEKLTEARQARDAYKAEAEALKAQIAELTAAQAQNLAAAQAQAQARADAGQAPTKADANLAAAQAAVEEGVDASLFGDFSEEALAKGIAQLVEQRAAALVDAKLNAALAPYREREAVSAADAHTKAIYAAHPDADEVHESAEFKKWVSSQPSYARSAIEQTLSNGNTQQVIEVFSAFKASTGRGNTADAVSKALANAQQRPPTSLSDLQGVSGAGATDAERVAALAGDPAALLDFMAGLSPEKQNRLMNSVV
jgi:Meckel syndrome type 1 protein